MNIKPVALSLCVILAACNGGGSGPAGAPGPQGAPGKSVYEIWLEQGNVGTEQNFLDSLVSGGNSTTGSSSGGNTGNENPPNAGSDEDIRYFTNTNEYQEYLKNNNYGMYSDFVEQKMDWAKHNGYKHYEHKLHSNSNTQAATYTYTYNEKELNLGNYGVYESRRQEDFEYAASHLTYTYTPYIHNREGVGANVYTPNDGTVFKGGTLAYLIANETELIKGDATFTYNPTNPKVNLAFENYYNISFEKSNASARGYDVNISGTNNTGKSQYNLPIGKFPDRPLTAEFGYVSKNGIEEAFGTYQTHFYDSDYDNTGTITNDFGLTGAFGGEKK